MKSILIILFVFVLNICNPNILFSGPEFITDIAKIKSITVNVLKSYPKKVNIVVKGYLGDSCTVVGKITQFRINNTFHIKIMTKRPVNKICVQIIKEFEETIILDTRILRTGNYQVEVNGLHDNFVISF